MKIIAILFTLILILPAYSQAADLNSENAKFSYAVGVQIGQSLKRDKLDINPEIISEAITDVLKDKKLQLTPQAMQAAVQSFQKKAMDKMKAIAEDNKIAGKKYLDANKAKKGVTVTKSGVQYKVIKAGTGKSPTEKDNVVVHYRGTLIDGTVFDSSIDRGEPASFGVGQVIKGWKEVLQLMKVGSKWEVTIPSDLAYGENGAGGKIGPNSTLVFEVELLEIKK